MNDGSIPGPGCRTVILFYGNTMITVSKARLPRKLWGRGPMEHELWAGLWEREARNNP